MKNNRFNVEFDHESGTIASLSFNADTDRMNWCAEDGKWGTVRLYESDSVWRGIKSVPRQPMLESFSEDETSAVSVYSNGFIRVTVTRRFDENGDLRENFVIKNLVYADQFIDENSFAVEAPLNDRYTYADDCVVHRCNAHIWCGLESSWINALKMGESNINLGLVVTKGSLSSYSQKGCKSNSRGIFLLHPTHFELSQGEEYELEWVIFSHSGNADFFEKALRYDSFIRISSEHFTLFRGERLEFTAYSGEKPQSVRVWSDECELPHILDGDKVKVDILPDTLGEKRIFVEINGHKTYADFIVKESFKQLVENRISFIVDKQQYNKPGSPLDGAFLIYDNSRGYPIFDDRDADHNASRERLGMGLLIAKYLQKHENAKFRAALMRYDEFLRRECYDAESGYVFNTIGKDKNQVRLYNAPWMSMFFTEMYTLTGEKSYLDEVLKLFRLYYSMGGSKFYPNGISILRTANAFKNAGMDAEYREIFDMFRAHVDNMVEKHISYPKHEVNFEQTIVSPAATFISEFALLSGEKKYADEARYHIEILARFDGCQPSYHLNEIPIRYWDDFWFGKRALFGDTLPHYWSCLSARSFEDYYRVTGDVEWKARAVECIRNCMCLFTDDGKGSAAYVYPYRTEGFFGELYDDWANDQDFALYFAIEAELLKL